MNFNELDELEQMLTVKDVSRLLRIHANTLRRWSDKGIIKSYRVNSRGDRRFRRGDILQFLNEPNANGGDERKAGKQSLGAGDSEKDVPILLPFVE